jgi:outer membrane biosynthesis protein TonB
MTIKITVFAEGADREELSAIANALAALSQVGTGLTPNPAEDPREKTVVYEEVPPAQDEKPEPPKPRKRAPKQEPKEEPNPAKEEPNPAKEEPNPAKEDQTTPATGTGQDGLRAEIRALVTEKVEDHREEIKKKLAFFDAKNVTRLAEEHLPAMKKYLESL